eukprot:m.28241 g.28241  ORF g.28241 m.28241 type:complete len:692 (+) comp8787_c0_seq1:266-2341(+)
MALFRVGWASTGCAGVAAHRTSGTAAVATVVACLLLLTLAPLPSAAEQHQQLEPFDQGISTGARVVGGSARQATQAPLVTRSNHSAATDHAQGDGGAGVFANGLGGDDGLRAGRVRRNVLTYSGQPMASRRIWSSLWQAWRAPWSGQLSQIDLYLGPSIDPARPCLPMRAVLTVLQGRPDRAGSEVLHRQTVTTQCGDCAVTQDTCLMAPACAVAACMAWQTWQLVDNQGNTNPIDVTAATTYAFVLSDVEPEDEVGEDGTSTLAPVVYAGVTLRTSGQLEASNVPKSPNVHPAFDEYAFRSYMAAGPESSASVNGSPKPDTTSGGTQATAVVVGAVATVLILLVVVLFVVFSSKNKRRWAADKLNLNNQTLVHPDTANAHGCIGQSQALPVPTTAWGGWSLEGNSPMTQVSPVRTEVQPYVGPGVLLGDSTMDNTDTDDEHALGAVDLLENNRESMLPTSFRGLLSSGVLALLGAAKPQTNKIAPAGAGTKTKVPATQAWGTMSDEEGNWGDSDDEDASGGRAETASIQSAPPRLVMVQPRQALDHHHQRQASSHDVLGTPSKHRARVGVAPTSSGVPLQSTTVPAAFVVNPRAADTAWMSEDGAGSAMMASDAWSDGNDADPGSVCRRLPADEYGDDGDDEFRHHVSWKPHLDVASAEDHAEHGVFGSIPSAPNGEEDLATLTYKPNTK